MTMEGSAVYLVLVIMTMEGSAVFHEVFSLVPIFQISVNQLMLSRTISKKIFRRVTGSCS